MTEAEILSKIMDLKRKITYAQNRIKELESELRQYENAYDQSSSFKNAMQTDLSSYYSAVISRLNKLDTHSTFRKEFQKRVDNTLQNRAVQRIEEIIWQSRRAMLESIEERERLITIERQKIDTYRREIFRLQNELKQIG